MSSRPRCFATVWARSRRRRRRRARSPGRGFAPSDSLFGPLTPRIKAGTGIRQGQARPPACPAMTALTRQALSNNRFLLGIGASGPQVVEGWHGVPFGKPMARTREYIEILRKILKREAPLQHDGELYQIPYKGPGATGLGKPLKSILHGDPNMPIYAASITPIGLRTAGEVAGAVLPIFMSPEKTKMVSEPLQAWKAAGKTHEVGSMLLSGVTVDSLRVAAEAVF